MSPRPVSPSEAAPDFRTLIERSGDAYFRFVVGVGLTDVNSGFLRLTGRQPPEVLRQPGFLEQTLAHEGSRELTAAFEQLRAGTVPHAQVVTSLLHRDGRTVWVEVFLVAAADPEGKVIGVDGCARDVSEHMEVAELLSRRTSEQAVLLKLQREILTHIDSDVILTTIVEEGRAALKASGCGLYVIAADGVTLDLAASCGESTSVDSAREATRLVTAQAPVSPGGTVSAPVMLGEQFVGSLVVRAGPMPFQEAELDFLMALAQVAALALANLQTYHEVKRQATLDGLTGAFNRRFFDVGLQDELARARRLSTSVGLLILDVDDLKKVNDQHGHVAGDLLLKALVRLLKQNLRDTDWVARYGGDEFTVVLPGCQPDQLRVVAESLYQAIVESPVELQDGEKLKTTVSIGGAVFPDTAEDPASLLQASDAAEREAKRLGGGRVVVRLERA